MASSEIHLAVAKKYFEKNNILNYEKFIAGSLYPDACENKDQTHYTDSNRGRLFYSESKLDQVVIVSAKIIDVNPHNEVKLEYNAKTGVEDYGTLLLAILGAFTVGYIALRFKEEPVSSL